METEALIEALADPRAYPHEAPAPQLIQTHISVVALAGPWVYKIKKPLDLGFLDFRELSDRHSMCAEEVRLNRRLAPHIYQGVVALTRNAQGQLRVGGSGEPVEYAVQMRRLPDEATLAARLERDELDAPLLGLVGRRLARFHEAAARGESVQKMASYEQVAFNHRENLEQTEPHIGRCVSAARHEAVRERVELELARRRALIDDRAARRACEGHGDLRLEHVYVFEDQQPPRDLVVLDAIEFNERFRHADPIADLAFPVMELLDVGRRDLADALTDAWARQTQDLEGLALMPLYVSYRALVRAKVDGIMAGEPEVPEDPRAEAAARARRRWRLAERALTRAQQEPALILVAGLPGSGKSTLARHLAGALGARIVATDRVRKELAGLAMDEPAEAAFGEGIYTEEWSQRTYATCLAWARAELEAGGRVIVDANLRRRARRRAFLELAQELGIQATLLVCRASEATTHQRLEARAAEAGEASDADWAIYERAAARWEPPDEDEGARLVQLPEGTASAVTRAALAALEGEPTTG